MSQPKKLKFGEAFWTDGKKEDMISIKSATEVFNENPLAFRVKYRNTLFCPTCKQAHLLYVNDNSPHFRAYPKAVHSEDCYLAQDVFSQAEIRKNVEEKNYVSIERTLSRLISQLLAPPKSPSPMIDKFVTRPPENESERERRASVAKRLSTKSVYSLADGDCFGRNIAFYGKVFLNQTKLKKDGGYGLQMCDRNTRKQLCTVWITKDVDYHLSPKYKKHFGTVCLVSFFGEMRENPNNTPSLNLITSQFLKIGEN